MRRKGDWTSASHSASVRMAEERGSATAEGEKIAQETGKLERLVDPKEFNGVRESRNLLVPDPAGSGLILTEGIAMPVKTGLDTTGSMGGNVELAFGALPRTFKLLVQGPQAILKRYHVQIATAVIQDQCDRFAYELSQFEPDNEIDNQMGLLVPEKSGGDSTEDYQLDIFASAWLTRADISKYGIKGYSFIVGDEIGRDEFDLELLKRVFGKNVLKNAGLSAIPTLKAACAKLLESWHAFFLQVGSHSHTSEYWKRLLGLDRVIRLPKTEFLPEVQACIIGLTEGVLDLQSAADFLKKEGKLSAENAELIVRACSNIPLRAQADLPNFDRIPAKGAWFANREDTWPTDVAPAPKKQRGGVKWAL